jgi:GNAT superfamily N-acetyltransferase
MPDVGDEGVWTILCMFIRRAWRGKGVTHVLLEGAVDYARSNGAQIVEAYPWDTADLSGTGPARHWGHSKVYASVGFHRDGEARRWVRRINPKSGTSGLASDAS